MQDPPNPNKNPNIKTNPTPETQTFPHGQGYPFSFRTSCHRRAHSEVHFRLPEDLDLVPDPFEGPSGSSFDELGSEDDLFSAYMDIEKFESRTDEGPSGIKPDNAVHGLSGGGGGGGEVEGDKNVRPRHRYSNSVDGSSVMESIEAKKAMAPGKLAELWTVDPKRAKRIIANRQSATRSKERKAHYMSELERKVQTLQTEATTLSARLTLFQRDTTGLTTENTELKIRLQAMEQQAQLRDALNEALKKEVERLKIATGEMMTPADAYNFGMHHVPCTQSSYFQIQSQPRPVNTQNMQMPQLHPFQFNMPIAAASHSHALLEILPQDPLGLLQGLDIGSKSTLLVKSEGPSLSASESSSI
ncbi:transcription factor RF2b [Hevea brasiliensis]|uniref:transcription factor RF2b n=1 Tax=Hevea brasiliensis TaxID=3981 RepID=UPI0025DADEBB|nr:transcription factor RF2b [Hevea brasiliensis]